MPERSSTSCQDNPLSGEESREFDQFGSMQGEMRRDLNAFKPAVGHLVSSSRGYQSQLGARSSGQKCFKRKSTLQPFLEQGETSHCATIGIPLTERGNEVGGGSGRGSGSWSGHSSPSYFVGAAFEPHFVHLEYNVHTRDEQSTEMEVDNLAAVPQRVFGKVVPNNALFPNAGAQPPSDLGAM